MLGKHMSKLNTTGKPADTLDGLTGVTFTMQEWTSLLYFIAAKNPKGHIRTSYIETCRRTGWL
jgi:hypothetical protein